jgi:hypothetical protein
MDFVHGFNAESGLIIKKKMRIDYRNEFIARESEGYKCKRQERTYSNA